MEKDYRVNKIVDCICGWVDLLGYGKPFIQSNWNLNDDLCKKQLNRIKELDCLTGSYSIMQGKSLSLNDGCIFNYDINKTEENFIRNTIYYIDHLINDYDKINYRDKEKGYPGARGIITYGHRYSYSYADTTYSCAKNDNVSFHPKEFQMNTAFSKAYLMESSGSKCGISGNSIFIDNYLLTSLEKLIKEQENNNLKASREEIDTNLKFTVYDDDKRLISLIFNKKTINYNNYGIETELYRFETKESILDDMAYEASYRRSVALSEMEEE